MDKCVFQRRDLLMLLLSGLLGCARVSSSADYRPEPGASSLDHELSPELADFVRIRGSLNPSEDVYYYFRGEIFLVDTPSPNQEPKRRFRKPFLWFEGINVARFIPQNGGVRMLSREVAYYLDKDGNPVDCLKVPWLEQPISVMQVANDPVNFTLSAPPSYSLGGMKVFVVNASVDYPSPLQDESDVMLMGGKTYQSTELFQFYAPESELRENNESVSAWMSWSRVGQPLPWMYSPVSSPRSLIYHTRGYKVRSGFDALPEGLRNLIAERHPSFMRAPELESQDAPNQTSWTAFKERLSGETYERACQIPKD